MTALTLEYFLATHPELIKVTLSQVRGSSPREVGACLYVTRDAIWGTIGGGQLEYMAIDEARCMLRDGRDEIEMTVPLGPEIGQCCGGHVILQLMRMQEIDKVQALTVSRRAREARLQVLIFGAGHVGRALAQTLQLLPVTASLIDSRAQELALSKADIKTILTPLPEAVVQEAPAGSAFVVVTHDHSLDFLVASAALERQDAAYVGMIGSQTKRAMFKRSLKDLAAEEETALMDKLTCPIGALTGGKLSDKRPEVIAAMVAAEIMIAFETQSSGVSVSAAMTRASMRLSSNAPRTMA